MACAEPTLPLTALHCYMKLVLILAQWHLAHVELWLAILYSRLLFTAHYRQDRELRIVTLIIIIIVMIIIIIIKLVQLDEKHWYEHAPKSVETSQGGKVTILWNQQVQTDRTVPNNKPDIIIRDNEKGTCMLIDVAISGDRNVIKKRPRRF